MTKKATRMGAAKTVVATTGLVAIFGAAAGVAAPVAAETSAPTATTSSSASAEALSSTVRKSVTMSGDADGTINQTAMVTQVSAVGDGNMTVNVPIGTDSVRNLDGFGSVPVQDQNATFNLNVNGSAEQRTYSTAEQNILAVKAKVTLDGKPIDAKDVVGKTGLLDVEYTVVNSGKSKQTVSYQNVRGETVTEEQEVDLPIGGSVEIVLPQGFNEITATGANIGGDGTGQTKLSYSLVLFAPLGNPVATFGYQTRIAAGTLPSAEFTFLPIVPLDNPSVVTAKKTLTGVAESGTSIYGAGVKLSENLLKLQDGAAQLLAGLTTAASGASDLAAGLNNTAVPGARKLEDGAGELAAGLAPAAPGAEKLATGIDGAATGAGKLAFQLGPQGQIGGGINTLAAGAPALKASGDAVPVQAKKLTDAATAYSVYLGLLNKQIEYLTGTPPLPSYSVKAQLGAIKANAVNCNLACGGAIDVAVATLESVVDGPNSANPPLGISSMEQVLNSGFTYLGKAVPAMTDVNADLTATAAALTASAPGTKEQLNALAKGLLDLQFGVVTNPDPLTGAYAGASALAGGLDFAAENTATLATGLAKAADGSQQLADGTTKLADGLVTAADGSQQLADGLPAAVDGIAQAEQGAVDLREQGSEVLATTGEETQAKYALQLGQVAALQQIGVAGTALPYGPATATGGAVNTSGVYQLTLAAAPSGSSNALVFGLAALGLIAGGAVGVWAYRRRTV
jgi:putative membrane protein